jgi:hypothetical protein
LEGVGVNSQTVRDLGGLAIGLWLLAQSGWILFVRPDPPVGAVTATRRSRTIIAGAAGIFAIIYLFFVIQSFI